MSKNTLPIAIIIIIIILIGAIYPTFTYLNQISHQQNPIKIIITPHHLLAKPMIDHLFSQISQEKFNHIILISPDHLKQIPTNQSILLNNTNNPLLTNLTNHFPHQITNNSTAYNLEHGVNTLTPIIQAYFPTASISSLIISNQTSQVSNLNEIFSWLQTNSPPHTLLIISTDFSHHSTNLKSQFTDQISLFYLNHLNYNNFQHITNDCPNCWLAPLNFSSNSCHFTPLDNQNSTHFAGPNQDVTSYITSYWKCK